MEPTPTSHIVIPGIVIVAIFGGAAWFVIALIGGMSVSVAG